MSNLKNEWDNFKSNWDKDKGKYLSFKETFSLDKLKGMKLEEYTALKDGDKDSEYFTYWLERGTEAYGKFRTGSSYAYGVYKVNPDNIPKNIDVSKWNKGAPTGYRTGEIRSDKKDEFKTGELATEYFEKYVRPKIIELAEFKDIDDLKPLEINYCRKIAYLYNPDKLIPIYKGDVIEAIAEFFVVNIDGAKSSYKATESILTKINEVFELNITPANGFEITQKLGAFLWEYFGKSFPLDSKNMILHGAPGTGKTYAVENGIKEKLRIEVGEKHDEYYTLQQFHPSFGYEEFIDGIKPEGIGGNGQMSFKLVNGVFKKMCIAAAKNLKEAKLRTDIKNFYFVADEINRAELSRVFGEVLLCLEEDKRLTYKNGEWKGTKVETLNSALWEEGDAVITVNGKQYFGVPENIYFIGTMNDIDRSVDSFDMALRRRFLWKHYECDYRVISEHDSYERINENDLKKYITICENLNDHITGKSGFDLGESFQLGHSYFLKPKKLNQSQINETWENHIKPLLREYLRSSVPLGEIEKHLKKAQNIFKLKG